METRRLEINSNCWFEVFEYYDGQIEVSLTYVERSPDPWYSDSETDVPIDRDMAIKIIGVLRTEFGIEYWDE